LRVHPLADTGRRNDILAALQHERRDAHARHVGAIVREEGDARELAGDVGIGCTEAVGQCLAKLRPVGIAHDRRRHRRRPTEMIVGQELEHLFDLRL
jgi:hypothetical protein